MRTVYISLYFYYSDGTGFFSLSVRQSVHSLLQLWLYIYKGQFKKKVTLSHVYNEATSEPTIT
jgi:hypothetical protein